MAKSPHEARGVPVWLLALSMAIGAVSPLWVERGHDRSAEVVAKAQKEAAIEVAKINAGAAIRVAELNNQTKVAPKSTHHPASRRRPRRRASRKSTAKSLSRRAGSQS